MADAASPSATPAGSLPAVERFFQFSLLGMLASGYFAVATSGYLDWPTQAVTLLALFLRGAWIAGWLRVTLSNRAVAVLTLGYMGFYPLDYQYVSDSFPVATLHLVFFLAVMKLLTASSDRDYAYLKMIAGLELMAAAMLSVSLSFFAFLALFLLCTVASLASNEVRRSSSRTDAARAIPARSGARFFERRLGAMSLVLFTGILVMTAGMFFVLPRTARAALSRFVPQRYHLPGFTNEVTLGEIGEIKQSSRAVMHVRSDTGEGLMQVRWRGSSLSRFDGLRWFNPPARDEILRVDQRVLVLGAAHAARPGREISYQVQLDEIAGDTLFFAGIPETISIGLPTVRRTADGAFRVMRMPMGIEYRVYSFLEDETAAASPVPAPLAPAVRQEMLGLPAVDPRIPELARSMTRGVATDAEKARVIEQRLRHDYGYTLQLLPSAVADPLAHFLFVRKKGHCEYFASAMAVMLRTLGIPARVATGFQSGVYNPLTQAQVVRASDAHSWVEAWLPGSGWTTFDPTPVDPRGAGGAIGSRLALFLDAADQFWQDWVLSYDVERQVVLASRMEESSRRFRMPWISDIAEGLKQAAALARRGAAGLIALAAFLILAVIYGPTLKSWWLRFSGVRRARRGQGQASDATLLYQRMLKVLSRRGFQKPAWLTPAEFARVLPQSEVSILVEDLTAAYNEFRFGGRQDVALRMVRLLERLERTPG